MMNQRVIALAVLCTGLLAIGSVKAQQPSTLRVAMYPYVPDGRELFFELEAAFEAAHPGINLELTESFRDNSGKEQPLSWYYYSGGLLATEADVYEIDTILLEDMIQAGKITPVSLPKRDFLTDAVDAVHVNGKIWAVPHWVCGNFLFFEKGDTAIKEAKTWGELMAAFESGGHLLIDLKGRSTLGEWYLTSLSAQGGNASEILERLRKPSIDESAANQLRSALEFCPTGFCRSEELHDRTGFYARMFARGRARAYVGYSETLHYALSELAESCAPTDGCIDAEYIDVRELPGITEDAMQVGWVDGFGIAISLDARKKDAARSFVDFATSWSAYKMILEPEWPASPRYLLPAVKPDTNEEPLSPAFYTPFYAAFGTRLILNKEGINSQLRNHGSEMNCRLPAERDDEDYQENCPHDSP